MMNSGIVQNMAAFRGGHGPQQPQGGMQRNDGRQPLKDHIFRLIQQQEHPPGWQTAVTIQQRTINVFQLISSLRLIMPDMSIQQSVEVAMGFERKTFLESQDKKSYEEACQKKLSAIAATRTRQAAAMQRQMQNFQPSQFNTTQQPIQMQVGLSNPPLNQFQQGFPNPQLGHPMQPSPLQMQQQPPQQPQFSHMNTPMMNSQVQARSAQPTPQNIPQQIPQPQNQIQLTQEEQTQIHHIAQKMAQNATSEQLNNIRQKLSTAPIEQRQAWARQNADPLALWFRNVAMRQFVASKAKALDTSNQQQLQGGMASTTGIISQQGRPTPQIPISSQNQPMAATSGFDPSYTGNIQQNMNQIRGLQADALRSQELGHQVVPASTSQMLSQQQPPQGVVQPNSQQQPFGQPTVNRSAQNQNTFQQQYLQAQQTQQEKMQQAARNLAQTNQSSVSLQNQLSQQVPLQGQVGGLNNPMGLGLPQQSPAMPNLNRPVGNTNQQSQAQGTPSQRTQPRPVQANVAKGSEQPMSQGRSQSQQPQPQPQSQRGPPPQQNNGSQMQRSMTQMPPNMPPQVQQRLNAMSENERMNVLNRWRQQAQQRANQQLDGRPTGALGNLPVPGLGGQVGQQQPAQAQPSNQNVVGQPQIPLSGGNMAQNGGINQQQNSLALANQRIGNIRGSQQAFKEALQNQQRVVSSAANTLTEAKAREMDRFNYPKGILNNQVMLAHLPPDILTWGQLKAWVAQNMHSMPADILDKLKGLQALHYQSVAAQQQKRLAQRMSNIQDGQQPTMQQPGPAPQANMVQPRNVESNVQGTNTSRMPASLPPGISAPTMQDIQNARATNLNLKDASNEQIASLIVQTRYKHLMKVNQGQGTPGVPIATPQQSQSNSMHRSQPLQQPNQQQYPTPVNQNSSTPQQQPFARPPRQPIPNGRRMLDQSVARQPQSARPTAQSNGQIQSIPKGIKRNNTDDVVEVPNPNIPQQQPLSQRIQGKQPSNAQNVQNSVLPNFTPDQLNAMPQQQRNLYEMELRRLASQRGPQPSAPAGNGNGPADLARQKNEDDRRKMARIAQIVKEVIETLPARPPILMDEQTRLKMIEHLQSARPMVQKMEEALPSFFKTYGDEKTIRDLITTRMLLVRQYRDKEYNPVAQFTITFEELGHSIFKLKKFFQFMMQKQKGPQTAPPPQQNVSNTPQVQNQKVQKPSTQGQVHQLSEANLEGMNAAIKAEKQPPMQRNHSNRDHRAPAAPTTSQAPYSFGAQSPTGHGVPQYATNAITQDKLKLPPTKKRKANQAGSTATTPAQALGTPASISSPQVSKIPSPELHRTAVPAAMLKCAIPDCEASKTGFTTAEELNRHMAEIHKPKEPPIEDPLAWALESIRFGLGVNEQGKLIPVEEDVKNDKDLGEAQAMKASLSTQGRTPVKQEDATPMSRGATQTGLIKDAKTSKMAQQKSTDAMTPSSDLKPTLQFPNTDAKPSSTANKGSLRHLNDPWTDATISPSELSACFPTFSDLQGALSDNGLTPPSTLSSGKSDKNSPRPSDISENDALKIDLDWDWLSIPSVFDDVVGSGVGEGGWATEWGDVIGNEMDLGDDGVGKTGKARGAGRKDDEWVGSEGFDSSLFAMDLY